MKYFELCRQIATLSKCVRGKVGCIIVKDGKIIATGANNPPQGIKPLIECRKTKFNLPT